MEIHPRSRDEEEGDVRKAAVTGVAWTPTGMEGAVAVQGVPLTGLRLGNRVTQGRVGT